MTWTRLAVTAALVMGLAGQGPAADLYRREDIGVPLPAAGSHDLEALLVRSNEPGRYPLDADNPRFAALAIRPPEHESAGEH